MMAKSGPTAARMTRQASASSSGFGLQAGIFFPLNPDGDIGLLIVRDLRLIGVAWPNAGQINLNALLGSAQQTAYGLPGQFADGVPKRVLQSAPLDEAVFQMAFDREQVLPDERR